MLMKGNKLLISDCILIYAIFVHNTHTHTHIPIHHARQLVLKVNIWIIFLHYFLDLIFQIYSDFPES